MQANVARQNGKHLPRALGMLALQNTQYTVHAAMVTQPHLHEGSAVHIPLCLQHISTQCTRHGTRTDAGQREAGGFLTREHHDLKGTLGLEALCGTAHGAGSRCCVF